MNQRNNKEIKLSIDEINLNILKSRNVTKKYLDWLNDYEIVKYTEQKNITHSIDSIKNYVSEKYDCPNNYLFGIFFKKKHIGNIKLGPINFKKRNAALSYFIGERKFWNKGITSKVIKRISDFALQDLGINEIFSGSYNINEASKKVLYNNDFKIEEILVKQREFEGKKVDVIIMKKILSP